MTALLLDVRGASSYLGLSQKAVRRMVEKGHIPVQRIGPYRRQRVRFLQTDLDAWLLSRSASPSNTPA